MDEVLIAVMGPTGSGKTTFVNQATGASLEVGGGLRSCTSDVEAAGPFHLDGHSVILIDTPGFDDTTQSDLDILYKIAGYLSATYKDGKRVSGIIYMHRISDVRMGGISRRNFKMFRELCGEKTLINVVIVTNMWGNVSREIGEAQEEELATTDLFFKPCLEKGARMLRNDPYTQGSTHNILRHILANHPLPLQIQKELVDEGKAIPDTSAGVELGKELKEEAENHRNQLEELHNNIQGMYARARKSFKTYFEEAYLAFIEAMKSREEEHMVRMRIEAEQHQNRIREMEVQSSQLQSEFERHQMEAKLAVQEAQEKARGEAEQAAIEFERKAAEIRRQTQEEAERAQREAERIQQEIRRAQEEQRNRHPLEEFGRHVDEGTKWFFGEVGRTFGWW